MLFVLLFSILLIGAVDGRRLSDNLDHECKQNETFKTIHDCNFFSEQSCTIPYMMSLTGEEDVRIKCDLGCKCKDGYMRNPEGECVKWQDCPYEDPKNKCKSVDCGAERQCAIQDGIPVCAPKILLCQGRNNETYEGCGTKNEPSCENPNRLGRTTDECVAACQCEKGFLRNKEGVCVKPEDCYPDVQCPKNELYEKCGTKNEPSCENPDPLKRKFGCAFTGCQCEKGLLRRADKKCVKPIDCDTVDQECSENESFESCGSGCEPSCDIQNPTNCTRECVAGCQCDKGFLRRGDKKCVHESQCKIPRPTPTECSENELLVDCSDRCEDIDCPIWTADGFAELKRSPDCFLGCTKRCACKKGFFKNDEGRCVNDTGCQPPGHECKKNETFKVVGSGCEPSCRTPNRLTCFAMPKTGCQCNDGFLRNPEGECVKEADCPYEDPENKCKSVECRQADICLTHKGKPICVSQHFLIGLASKGLFKPLSPAPEGRECKENEMFTICKTSCSETKCNEEPKTCPDVCNGSGCVCQEGFFRDPFGNCMTDSDCKEQSKTLGPGLEMFSGRPILY